MRKFFMILCALCFVLGGTQLAGATVIVGPTGATTNTSIQFPLIHSYDQTGLSAGYVSGVTDWDTYFAGNPTHTSAQYNDFVANNLGWVEYDLGTTLLIDKLAFWNFGSGLGIPLWAVTSFNLAGDAIFLGNYTPTVPSPLSFADIFSFGPVMAQKFRLDIVTNNGALGFGIGEVAFSNAPSNAPVPEPATMLLLGSGLAGLVGFRRKFRKR